MSFIRRERLELDPQKFATANLRRTPGVHLTDVVRDMLGSLGIMAAGGRGNTFTKADLAAFATQGFLWEDEMTETLVNKVRSTSGAAIGEPNYVRFPEIATDGSEAFWVEYDEQTGELLTPVPPTFIVMSPDGGVLEPEYLVCVYCKQRVSYMVRCDCLPGLPPEGAGGLALLECKRTAKAPPQWDADPQVRSDLLSKWLTANRPDWMWQTPCYLRGLSLVLGQEIDTVQHHTQFCVGDWRVKVVSDEEGRVVPLSPVPIYEKWTRKYSTGEVADRWDAVYGHARDTGRLNEHD